jgi:hypothetical protein
MLIPSLSLNLLLCISLLPLYLVPHSILHVVISHTYFDDLMRGYHCNKPLESKRMFHLGIAHNTLKLQPCSQVSDYEWK